MQEEQSTTKAYTTTSSHPDVGPYDPDTNPDGYLPIPLWVCRCDHYEPEPPCVELHPNLTQHLHFILNHIRLANALKT